MVSSRNRWHRASPASPMPDEGASVRGIADKQCLSLQAGLLPVARCLLPFPGGGRRGGNGGRLRAVPTEPSLRQKMSGIPWRTLCAATTRPLLTSSLLLLTSSRREVAGRCGHRPLRWGRRPGSGRPAAGAAARVWPPYGGGRRPGSGRPTTAGAVARVWPPYGGAAVFSCLSGGAVV